MTMTITLDLDNDRAAKLTDVACTKGIDLSELLMQMTDDYLEDETKFNAIVERVLAKNAELYKRLGSD